MATRLKITYTPATIYYGQSSLWENPSSGTWKASVDNIDTLAQEQGRSDPGSVGQHFEIDQFVSDPIPEQYIEGTVTALIGGRYFSTGRGTAYMVVRVMSPPTGFPVERGVLFAGPTSPPSFGATAVSMQYANGDALTPVQAQEGDRIVIEIGAVVSAVGPGYYLYRGARPADSDFTAAGQAISGRRGWVEFSQTLWPATADLSAETSVASGGAGTMEATGGSPDENVTTAAALSFVGGDLDVYEPVPISATCAAEAFLGGDLTEVLFLSEEV